MIKLSRPPQPQRAFSASEIRALDTALIEAWRRLPSESYPAQMFFDASMYPDEDKVTSRLEYILNRILEDGSVPSFNSAFFQGVIRDGKVRNHDGSRDELMPDLRFSLRIKPAHLTALESDLAFLVEAKVFEGRRGLPKYFREGIQRFINGDYAHKTDTGMMLAYSSKKLALPTDLDKYIKKPGSGVAASNCIGGVKMLPPVSGIPWGMTTHHRTFNPATPHNFELHHLWLRVPSVPSPP